MKTNFEAGPRYRALTPLARRIMDYAKANGSISAREAALDLDVTSASLTRRITDIENAGFDVKRASKTHPVTGKRYTRYAFADSSRQPQSA